MAAQRGEACVHFGGQHTGNCPCRRVFGPEPRLRVAAGQFLGDGQAFRHHGPFGCAHHRNRAGGKEPFQQARQVIGIKPGALHPDRQAEGIEQQPAAQRPAGIGAVAYGKVIGQGRSPSVWHCGAGRTQDAIQGVEAACIPRRGQTVTLTLRRCQMPACTSMQVTDRGSIFCAKASTVERPSALST